jgi:hypothetical protein
MATAPSNLPLFYHQLEPLSSSAHGNLKTRPSDTAPFLAKAHAVPLTSDEFIVAQRFYPIVFSVGDSPVPLALMGLNEDVNVFVDEEGRLTRETYVPAYVRRYPFMLARLQPDAEELSLCFDPSSDVVGDYADGSPLFEDGKPTQTTNDILKFCEEFELSAQRTNAFMQELAGLDLLIDGEVSIQPSDTDAPFVYRGFKMVAEEKLRDLRGDTLRKINQNGILPLVVAHLFSLQLIRDIFGRQLQMGKVPGRSPEMAQA